MASIFGSNAGRAIGIKIDDGFPALVTVDGFPSQKAIITSVGFSQTANVQFMHTLRDKIFVYAFGEKMGEVSVAGIAFAATCRDGGPEGGLAEVLGYYAANTVSQGENRISISLAGKNIKGFLIQAWSGSTDAERGISSWQLRFASLPQT